MESWVTKSISEVILKTKTIDPRKSPDKDFMYVDVSGVCNKALEITESTKLAGKDAPSRARRVISEGNIIFATVRPTLKRIAVVPSHLDGEVCSTGYFVFQPTSKLYNRYLYYFLQSDNFMNEMEKLQKGASYPAVNDSQVKSRLISYPSIPEQKRIVALLDTVFADLEQTRAKTEQNLKNARELFDSYLQQVFSQKGDDWIDKTLKEVSLDFGRGKSKHRPRNDESLYGGEFPFVQTGDVRNCEHLITEYSKTYNEIGLAQSKLWPKGTICITIAANIAETGILNFDSCFPDSVIGVVVNPEVTTIPYVEFLLQSFKATLQAKGKGSAQDNINMGTFEKLKFPFPRMDKQNKMVKSLNELMVSVQKLEVIYQQKLAAIDELKKSILQKAFSGELTKG